ncbi:MAG: response regulator transcription factor [Leptospiraceae bacterium]|nr:response regulator transcription factor [Leptospiraceae bacterium]
MAEGKLRVYLADDHRILREGLKLILAESDGFTVAGEAGDGRTAWEELDQAPPDVAVLDISIPGLSGIEIARRLKRYHPQVKVVFLSRHDDEEYIDQMLDMGVEGYVLKDDAGEDLLRSLEAVVAGQHFLSPRINSRLIHRVKTLSSGARVVSESASEKGSSENDSDKHSLYQVLSPREREILKLIAEGTSRDEIARKLHIAPTTVKVHRQNIMRKLEMHSGTELVKFAIRSGLVEP